MTGVGPSWLTKEYIGKIFNDFVKEERDQKELIDWDCEIVSFAKRFKNMSTNLFKVKVTNKSNREEVYNALMKISSISASELKRFWFVREGMLYKDYFGEISRILKKIEGNTMIFPKLYHFDVDPLVIVIEDMSAKGFVPYSKIRDYEECVKVFKYLARYHAVSYYVHHELKMDLSKYCNAINEKSTEIIELLKTRYCIFQDVIAPWENCSQFSKKLKQFEPYYIKNCLELHKENTNGFNVLSHGDFHKYNFLIKTDNKDFILIDYEMSAWRSPAYDIIAALSTFCKPEVVYNSKNILIGIYHTEFKFVLSKLNFSHRIPSLLDVHQEILKHGLLNLTFWSLYKPNVIIHEFSEEKKKDSAKAYKAAFDVLYEQNLHKLFPEFLDLGYLENV